MLAWKFFPLSLRSKILFCRLDPVCDWLVVFAVFTLTSFFIYKKFENWELHQSYISIAFTLLYLFLLATGGEENTGLLWCYSYPLLIFSIVGHVRGKWVVLFALICTPFILFVPDWAWASHSYTDNMKYRFSGSILFVSAMAYLTERSRMMAQQENELAYKKLRKIARSDDLTSIYNRRGIKQKMYQELARVRRDNTEMSVVLCDVDLFKKINDRHGHDVGDAALKVIAQQLSETIRVTDAVGRWGGEEFLILLPNTRLNEGYQLIERVRQNISNTPVTINGIKLDLSISCGISSTRFFIQFDDLIKAADMKLYEAKTHGRNCTRPVVQA